MELGWIDFSEDDREKVLDVIKLLQEQGAIDELGIGLIRDAFANRFFPGTSTVQTKAKYFLIVPYVLKEAVDGKYGNDVHKILDKIDQEEYNCGKLLMKNCGNVEGIIGRRVLPRRWVSRKPSNIYWNGIKTYQIFKQDFMSIPELIKLSVLLREQKKSLSMGNRNDDAKEGDKDDKDAGKEAGYQFFSLPENHNDQWRDNLQIALTNEEAAFLRNKIEHHVPNTLLTYLLKNNIDVDRFSTFESLNEALSMEVPKQMSELMQLACDFNRLVYAARVRYNIILSKGENEEAVTEWKWIQEKISHMASVHIDEVLEKTNIKHTRLERFLKNLQEAFLTKDYEKADEIIKKQEIDQKGKSRSKLCHVEDYASNHWVGGRWLDFRFSDAKRIIRDIYEGEGVFFVSDK